MGVDGAALVRGIDEAALVNALSVGWSEFQRDPTTAVKSKRFISPLHRFCAQELRRRGFLDEHLVPGEFTNRATLLGAYLAKEVDVGLLVPDSGPLLAISVKSQMTSIANNATNRFEEYVGDATNLHTRYPMLVLGFMMVIPVGPETFRRPDGSVITRTKKQQSLVDAAGVAENTPEQEVGDLKKAVRTLTTDALPIERVRGCDQGTEIFQRVMKMLERASGRRAISEPPGAYEETCLLVVDFRESPPKILKTCPAPASDLRVESFFDRVQQRYIERNQFVRLGPQSVRSARRRRTARMSRKPA